MPPLITDQRSGIFRCVTVIPVAGLLAPATGLTACTGPPSPASVCPEFSEAASEW